MIKNEIYNFYEKLTDDEIKAIIDCHKLNIQYARHILNTRKQEKIIKNIWNKNDAVWHGGNAQKFANLQSKLGIKSDFNDNDKHDGDISNV